MSRTCIVTGKKPTFGHTVSHSNRRTKRRFDPNIQSKKYFVPSLGRTVKLKVSSQGIKIIDKRGIDAVVSELLQRGIKL